jgi:hypothetical protein
MGWIPETKQIATYIHLWRKQIDIAIIKAYGIEVQDNGIGESLAGQMHKVLEA